MPDPIPEEKMTALMDLIFRGRKIEAIKLYRELTRLGLKEAKDEVDAIEATLRKDAPEKFTAAPKGKGCFGAAAMLCLGGAAVAYWFTRK
jgi:ribosomal protein L7/L12